MRNKLLIWIILLIPFISCKNDREEVLFNTGKTREEMMMEIPLFSVKEPFNRSEAISAYARFYGIEFENTHHYYGYLHLSDFNIFTQLFIPRKNKGTIYIFHSFLSHTGIMTELIEFLLKQNFSVCALDLPGHGLSSGIRGNIDDFHQYGNIIHTLLNKTSIHLTPPFYAIGHSTGCSAVIDYFLRYDSLFRNHILLAPLVRSVMWYLSKTGYALLKWANPLLPYWQRDVSSDKEYMEFLRNETFLFVRNVPVTWVSALFTWNDYLESIDTGVQVPLHVIQGKKDVVVDWRYNIPFLQKLITGMEVTFIDKGKHDLHNECEEIQDEVFQLIMNDLVK